MTTDEALKELTELYNNGVYDTEGAHGAADDILCRLVETLDGGQAVVDLYNKFEKWYA